MSTSLSPLFPPVRDSARWAHDGGTRINKRLLDLGYARADVNALSQHREVRAEQPVTQRVWKRVLPLLVEELARVKAERLERERLARVEDRKHAVTTV